jgi:hypothetical protein
VKLVVVEGTRKFDPLDVDEAGPVEYGSPGVVRLLAQPSGLVDVVEYFSTTPHSSHKLLLK